MPRRYDDDSRRARTRRTGSPADVPGGFVKPAELAQARLFKSTLQDELARLNELASRLSSRHRQSAATDPAQHELAHTRECIDEVRRLLDGLRGRFGATA